MVPRIEEVMLRASVNKEQVGEGQRCQQRITLRRGSRRRKIRRLHGSGVQMNKVFQKRGRGQLCPKL